jgi:gluconolactonase
MRTLDADAQYPEGPLWRDGALFYVEFATQRISRWLDGRKSLFWSEPGTGPCALGAWRNGFLLCAYDANALIEIDRNGRTVARFDRDRQGQAFVGPNDLAPDGAGGFFFTASGAFDVAAPASGAVLHIDAAGSIRRRAEGLHYANGLAFDPVRRRLFVSEHLAARIIAFDVSDKGSLAGPTIFCDLPSMAPHPLAREPYAGGDGIKLAANGNLLVAHFGTGRLVVLARDGSLVRTIEIPLRWPTNLAIDPATGAAAVTAVADPWNSPHGGTVLHLDPDLLA